MMMTGHPSASAPYIIMGISSILLQITVLRLLLSTFSGNELDIGITLSFWLVYAGLGSYIGKKFAFRNAFSFSFILIALLSLPTTFAIKGIRAVLSLDLGEIVSFSSTILSTAVILLPICFAIGLQFPLAISYDRGKTSAGRIYGLEAFGAFIGGMLFTFVISSRIGAFELCLMLALLNITIAVYVSGRKYLTLFCVIPLLLYLGFHQSAKDLPWHGVIVSRTTESRYGEVAVVKVREQSSIYANGHLLFTYPDPQSEEWYTHIAMANHPAPYAILIIGGSPGILKEYLKYNVQHIDFVELDPKIIEISSSMLREEDRKAMHDQRVTIIIEDGRRFVKSLRKPIYDLIVLNLPQPSTAGINRFYTTDFFSETRNVLKEGGLLALSLPQSAGYIGKRMQMASGSVFNSLKQVFRHVGVSAQEYGSIFASDAQIITDPDVLADRFIQREIRTRYFHQHVFYDAFAPLNVEYVIKRLSNTDTVNTDLRPSAYLYNLMLWSEIHGGALLYSFLGIRGWMLIIIAGAALTCISLLISGKKKPVVFFSILTTGVSGMSFVLAVLLAYQSLYGYVYEMIGILSAMFMIGLYLGTVVTKHAKTPLKILFLLEVLTILLAIISPFFFRAELFFYVLIFLAGTITGGQFSSADLSLNDRDAGGKLYAMDLTGSFLGALIPSLLIIPLFGVQSAFLSIILMKAFSAVLVYFLKP